MVTTFTHVVLPPGRKLMRQGEMGDDIFVVLHGELIVTIEEDRDFSVKVYAGQYLGEMSFLKLAGKRGSTVTANPDGDAVHVAKMTVEDLQECKFDLGLFAAAGASYGMGKSGIVFVDVLSGRDMLAMDRAGTSDPYVTLSVGVEVATTSVQRKTLNPVWQETLEFSANNGNELQLDAFDWDARGDDDPMGSAVLDLSEVGETAQNERVTLLLDGEEVGSVLLRVRKWDPKYSRIQAACMIQRSWRGYIAEVRFKGFQAALLEMDANCAVCKKQTETRIRERYKILSKKHDHLARQDWATVNNSADGLAATDEQLQELAATNRSFHKSRTASTFLRTDELGMETEDSDDDVVNEMAFGSTKNSTGFRETSDTAGSNLHQSHVLHVRGIGVHGWDGTPEGRGTYENEGALRELFKRFGVFRSATIRHRVEDGENTSWALVTMGDEIAVERALSAPTVMAVRFLPPWFSSCFAN